MRAKKRSDGRYCRQVYIGKDPDTGKRRYKSFYAATAKEAEKLASDYRAAIGRGLDPDAGTWTVENLLDNLIAVKKAKGIGKAWERNLMQYKNHLRPLWKMEAEKVRTADVQKILNDAAESGLSHKTLTQISGTLSAAYDLAIPEVVQYNPCNRVVVPAGKPAKRREWLDDERQEWVRETPHRAQRAAMLMMYSGLRRGEATALTWADVDLNARTITVSKSWDFAAKKVKEPKTAAGNRVVHIPRLLADFLQQEREKDTGTLYVIHTAAGGRMTDIAWRRMWDSYMMDLNLKYGYHGTENKHAARAKDENGKERGTLPVVIRTFTPHELRHTFCTLLYMAGVDVLTARDQMGHASVQVTQEIYTHLDKKFKAQKMDKLDAFLEKGIS